MLTMKTPIYLEDPYFEHRYLASKAANKRFNTVSLVMFMLLAFGFATATFEWGVMTFALSFIAMGKAYFLIQISRYKKTLPRKEFDI